MIIGVVSDTHRNDLGIKKAIEALKECDLIIHLGDNVQDVERIEDFYDKEIIYVKGNCDFDNEVSTEIIKEISGKKFLITHGHQNGVKYGLNIIKFKALEEEVDIVLFGHTHESIIEFNNGIWFINPGSPSLPRDGYRSVAIIKITGEEVNPSIIRL